MVESLQDWWSLAGVDLHYANEPTALLDDPGKMETTAPKPAAMVADASKDPVTEFATKQVMPNDHRAFAAWLSNPDNLVESGWTRQFVMPRGEPNPDVMVIVAMPDSDSSAPDSLFSAKTEKLMVNMLAAINCDSKNAYFASVAVGRPIDGQIDEKHHAGLKDRMMHHISLVQPKRIIIFGDGASNILLNENLLAARKKKQFINHVSSKTEAITTFHPRILLERPELKAEAWKDLQMLTRISTP